MLRILIADDQPVVREGIKVIIENAFTIDVIDEASTGQETLEKIWNNSYDLVLLDISMPGRNGLDVLNQLRQKKSTVPVLVLSGHPEELFAIRSLKAGAAGFLTKVCGAEILVEAIHTVKNGEKFITPSLAKTLAMFIGKDLYESPHETLTDREFEVLRLIATGLHLNVIAEKLTLSPKTISSHRANILKKMNMDSNAEMICYAYEKGLLE
jgi:DNA-binding NarL/FixJ family response regulator